VFLEQDGGVEDPVVLTLESRISPFARDPLPRRHDFQIPGNG
jgi:hypothetical protein